MEGRETAEKRSLETDYKDAFSVLRHPMTGVNCLRENRISKLFKRSYNCVPGFPSIMRTQILHIFK